MRLDAYREVWALPGVAGLVLVSIIARLPVTAASITLTLHVVLGLERGYGAAGLVGAAFTVGVAVGGPILGRFVDRRGMRPMLVLTTMAQLAFWGTVPMLPFHALLATSFLAGLLAIPIFSIIRQSLAALVPDGQRKAAYSIDSMSTELAFMVGPAAAVVAVTQISTMTASWIVGAAICLSGTGLWLMNPPTRSAQEKANEPDRPVSRRTWLRPRLVAVLLAAVAATLVLAGADVGVVAILREAGELQFTSAVLALWAVYSLTGGFVYGALPHSPHPLLLAAALGVLTVPLGLAGGWGWLALLLIPAGALCAPTIAATADAVSRMVPAAARGEAMGLYGSALTVGMALGAPLAGVVVDMAGTTWAFIAVGGVGAVLALAGLIASRGTGHTSVPAAAASTVTVSTVTTSTVTTSI